MCGLKGQVLNVMKRTGLYDEIGRDHIYADSRAAISALIKILHTDTDLPADRCKNCPLTTYLPLAEEHLEETVGDGSILEKLFAAAAFAEQREFDTAKELLASTTNPHLKTENKP